MKICHIPTQNDPLVRNNFFWCKPLLLLSSTYWSFSLCKIKNSYSGFRVMRILHFWAQDDSFAPNKNLFGKKYHFHLPIDPFHCAKFTKNSYSKSRVKRMDHFWVQNNPFAKMRIFSENLLISLFLSFMPIYMPKIKVRY